MIHRREFLEAVAAVAVVPLFGRRPAQASEWGSPVFDLHHHLRQANNPAAARLAGKCVARETLSVLKTSTSPEIFRKIAWTNAHRMLRISQRRI